MTQHKKSVNNKGQKGLVLPKAAGYGFVVGVVLSGVLLVPVVSIREGIHPLATWVGGLLSTTIFLCILFVVLDKRKRWRWAAALAVLAVAYIGARMYFTVRGQPFVVLGGLMGSVLYFASGMTGLIVGAIIGKFFKLQR